MTSLARRLSSRASAFSARGLLAVLRREANENARARRLTLTKYGTAYGGWTLVDDVVRAGDLVVSLGAGEDVTFDVEIARLLACRVVVFDPTPRAIAHVEGVLAAAARGDTVPINHSASERYTLSPEIGARITFHPFAVAAEPGTLRLYLPVRDDWVSCSLDPEGMSDRFVDVECKDIHGAFALAGGVPRVLKMDIEGAEYDVVRALFAARTLPEIVCLELDGLAPRLTAWQHQGRVLRMLQTMRRGYDLVCVDGLNLTFLRR